MSKVWWHVIGAELPEQEAWFTIVSESSKAPEELVGAEFAADDLRLVYLGSFDHRPSGEEKAALVGAPFVEAETTHRCPPAGADVMPCCGRSPFEVPQTDRITSVPLLVNCRVDAVPSEQTS